MGMVRFHKALVLLAGAVLLAPAAPGVEREPLPDDPPGPAVLEKKVTLHLEREPLRAVLNVLHAKFALDFAATDEMLDDEDTVTLVVKDKPLIDVLEALAIARGLRLEVTGRGIVVLAWPRDEDFEDEDEDDEAEEEPDEGEPAFPREVAAKAVKADARVAKLKAAFPGMRAEFHWKAKWQIWVVELLNGDDEIGLAVVDENGEITKFHIEKGIGVGPQLPVKEGAGDNF